MPELTIDDLLPMPPNMGPPLPRWLAIYWPWYERPPETYPPPATGHYYKLSGPWVTIQGDPTNRHNFQPVHKTEIVEVNKVVDGATRKYLAYDCDFTGSEIRLYYTHDLLDSWVPYSGNPILGPSVNHYRWPSVVFDGTTFHMFLSDRTDRKVERWTSVDGINFVYQEDMVIAVEPDYMNPFVFFSPGDNLWHLYHQNYNDRELLTRKAATIGGLKTATDTTIIDWWDYGGQSWPGGATSAPSVMYRDGTYWLVVEASPGGIWMVYAFYSLHPDSGFSICPNFSILGFGINDEHACPIHLLGPGNKAYLFTTQEIAGGWYQRTWELKLAGLEFLRPNGVGSETNIPYVTGAPTHWEAVDDPVTMPDAAYVYAGSSVALTYRDLYALQNHSIGAGIINGVTVYTRVMRGAGAGGLFRASLRTHGVTYDGILRDPEYALAWVNLYETWEVNPYTGLPWTWDEVDALEAGVVIETPGDGLGVHNSCDQIYVEVEYGRRLAQQRELAVLR